MDWSRSSLTGRGRGRRAVASVTPREPGVLEAGRGVAYLAVRQAPLVVCVTGPGPAAAVVDALDPLLPGLRRSGARWTGAGALRGASELSWFAFDGLPTSVVLFTEPAGTAHSPLWLHVISPLEVGLPTPWRFCTTTSGTLPADVYAQVETARPVPVWDLPGFDRLAPGALLRGETRPQEELRRAS